MNYFHIQCSSLVFSETNQNHLRVGPTSINIKSTKNIVIVTIVKLATNIINQSRQAHSPFALAWARSLSLGSSILSNSNYEKKDFAQIMK